MITGNIFMSVYFIGGVLAGMLMRATSSWPRLCGWLVMMITFLYLSKEVVRYWGCL
jgi:hypothetical protein